METNQQEAVLEGHTSYISSVCISPDGKNIISGSEDKTTRIWDIETNKEEAVLEGHTDIVISVCISPDGKKIISGS